MSSDTAIKSPSLPSLPCLPRELLSIIASELDRHSLLALVRVSSHFLHLRDEHIWEGLDLSLPVYHGRYPLIQPYAEENVVPYGEWYEDECERAERRYRADLCAMLSTIRARADGQHWAKVRHIRLDLRPEAVGAVIDILRAVSPYLEMLTITAGGWHSDRGMLAVASDDTLDVRLITSELYFPKLDTINLLSTSISHAETLHLLCNMSPNLVTISAELDLSELRHVDGASPPKFPPLKGPTKLRSLTVEYGGDTGDRGPEDVLGGDMVDPDDAAATDVILGLMDESPELETFYLRDYTGSADHIKRDLLWAVDRHPSLRTFCCGLLPIELVQIMEDEGITFPRIRHLTLEPANCLNIFTYVPFLPEVESIYLSHSFPGPDDPSTTVPAPSGAQSLIPPVASQFRHSPHLRVLHTFWEDHSDEEEGFIHSYRRGDDELLHARLLLDHVEVSDCPAPDRAEDEVVPDLTIEYMTSNGPWRDRTYVRLAQPVWQDYTDLRGRAIPLEVLEEMRRVEGLSEEEWAKRGVEVGDEAWKVAIDYLDGQGAG